MKKICLSLIVQLCLLGVFVVPQNGFAFMTALSETGMRSTIAQAGLALNTVDEVAVDVDIGNLTFGSTGERNGAILSFNNIEMDGSVIAHEPVGVEVTTERSPYTGEINAGVNITLSDVEIKVDRFEIGSITVGSAPGEGPSFGRFLIRNYHARISGDIRITTH